MEKESEYTKKEFEILLKIFNYTDFDNEFDTNQLRKEAGIQHDSIFQGIKKHLIEHEVIFHKKRWGATDLFTINYINLGELIENSRNYQLVEDFNKLKRKGKGKLNPDLS